MVTRNASPSTVAIQRRLESLEREVARMAVTLRGLSKWHSGTRGNVRPAQPNDLGGLKAAKGRGEGARVAWVESGEVVPAKALARHLSLTPQALGPAERRDEIFSVVVKRHRYFPCEFLELERRQITAVCRALAGLNPEQKLTFWKRKHGVLRGRTVLQAVTGEAPDEQLTAVVRLARTAAEQGANLRTQGNASDPISRAKHRGLL